MVSRSGRLNPMEVKFAKVMASTGDATYSAHQAGYSSPQQRGVQNMQKPGVLAEIDRQRSLRIANRILPLALNAHEAMLASEKTSDPTRATLIKLAYDEMRKDRGDIGLEKDLADMTGDELNAVARQASIVLAYLSDRATNVTPEPPKPGVFE